MQFISECWLCAAAGVRARVRSTKKSTNDLCLFADGFYAIVATALLV